MNLFNALKILLLTPMLCSLCLAQQHEHPPGWPCNNPNNPECPVNTPPTCNVVVNNDYRFELKRPSLAHDVAGPIQLHFQRHYSSYPSYDLPLTFMWESLGIKDLMDDPHMDCCSKDIHFTRELKFPMIADFSWSGNPVTVNSKPNPILSGYKIQIKVRGKLAGVATVGAGFSEFHFDRGSMPHVSISDPTNNQIFDADLECVKTSATSVVGKPIEPSGTQTNPDLHIHP
jgi:hypothetical protein